MTKKPARNYLNLAGQMTVRGKLEQVLETGQGAEGAYVAYKDEWTDASVADWFVEIYEKKCTTANVVKVREDLFGKLVPRVPKPKMLTKAEQIDALIVEREGQALKIAALETRLAALEGIVSGLCDRLGYDITAEPAALPTQAAA